MPIRLEGNLKQKLVMMMMMMMMLDSLFILNSCSFVKQGEFNLRSSDTTSIL